MKRLMPVLLLLIPVLMGAELRRAEGALRVGRYLLAAKIYRAALEKNPENMKAEAGLARTQVAMGRCWLALERLEKVRSTPAWNHDTATVEGLCHLRAGRYSLAIAAFDEALLMRPDHALAWYGLYQAHSNLHAYGGAMEALEHLPTFPKGEVLGVVAALHRAEIEAPDQMDLWLHLTRDKLMAMEHIAAPRQVVLIEARRWMDVGHPQAAIRILSPIWAKARANIQVSAALAEAYRRVGDPETAKEVLDHVLLEVSGHPIILGARIRIAADQLELDTQQENLDRLQGLETPEAWATEWYISRKRAPSRALQAKEKWMDYNRGRQRSLDNLVPWESKR